MSALHPEIRRAAEQGPDHRIDSIVVNELDVLTHDAKIRRVHGAALQRRVADWQPFMCNAVERALQSHAW